MGLNRAGIVPGLLLVLLGLVFLLDALGALDAGETLADWWPLAIVAVGLLRLADRPPDRIGGAITAGIGLVLLAFSLDLADWSVMAYLWPIALIGVGAWLVFGRERTAAAAHDDDAVSAIVLLSGRELAPTSSAFRGGSLFAALGGIDLDLRGATLHPEGARIDATVLLGGCDIKVPPGWRVRISGPAILGAYENHTQHQVLPPDAPTLELRVLVALGGLDVKPVGPPVAPPVPPPPGAAGLS